MQNTLEREAGRHDRPRGRCRGGLARTEETVHPLQALRLHASLA